MTPFEIECARDERDRQQAEAAQDLYEDGCTDAGFGQLPRYVDEAYLAGYLATIKALPRDGSGQIQHYSPRQQFAFGYVDSPDACDCDEF
jgi:hypothetical protein